MMQSSSSPPPHPDFEDFLFAGQVYTEVAFPKAPEPTQKGKAVTPRVVFEKPKYMHQHKLLLQFQNGSTKLCYIHKQHNTIGTLVEPFSSFFFSLNENHNVLFIVRTRQRGYMIEIYSQVKEFGVVLHRLSKYKIPIIPQPEFLCDNGVKQEESEKVKFELDDNGLTVLSLFDGIGGALLALLKAGIPIKRYYCCEIDESCKKVMEHHYGTKVIHLGDVRNLNAQMLYSIQPDLIIGGSPCTDMTRLKTSRAGLLGKHSRLFFVYLDIIETVLKFNKDILFMLENVASMQDDDLSNISKFLGYIPFRFDSSTICPAKRDRFYWCNFHVSPLPSNKPKQLKTVIEDDSYSNLVIAKPITPTRNQYTLTWLSVKSPDLLTQRTLSTLEEERCMGLPDGYTNVPGVENRRKLIGNGFSIPVVAHILGHISNPERMPRFAFMLQRKKYSPRLKCTHMYSSKRPVCGKRECSAFYWRDGSR